MGFLFPNLELTVSKDFGPGAMGQVSDKRQEPFDCAGSSNTDLFIRNDNRLHGKHMKGIQFIVPMDLAPV